MAHVEKRSQGRWRARYRGPDGRERSKTFATRRDADRFLATTETAKLRGEWVAPERSRLTVGDWADSWVAVQSHLKPKTRAGYDSLLRTQVLPRWGGTALVRVTHAEVAAWVAGMRTHLSASRTRQAYHLFKAMLDAAVADNRLARNPAAGIELPRLAQSEHRYLTHAELGALADECGGYRTLVLVLGYCGLRWGEAAALRVRNIDLLRRRLEIVEAVTEVNGRLVFGAPKTHQRRSVPVPRFVADEIGAVLAASTLNDRLFTSPRGGVLRLGNWRRHVFDRATQSVGLKGVTPHELRHTAASLAIAAGANVKAVQVMLGHRSATLTLDRYGHLFGDELDAVAARLDEARAAFPRPERGLGEVRQLPS
jgi:integrase